MNLNGLKIAVDLANGSATTTAVETLSECGAVVDAIYSEPNGININRNCGSTHPADLQRMVKEGQFDCGFAFDGDADRLIAVDHEGNLINGDYILYIIGRYLKDHGALKDDVIVTTVMANLGLHRALDRLGIDTCQTAVGDKYVYECMQANGYTIGGEQSGHIIFNEYLNTGDGLLTALELCKVMKETGLSLKELGKDLFIYPQVLKNLEVKDKQVVLDDPQVNALIAEVEKELGDEGRILVRPSGTEPLLRVMVEAKTVELCEEYVSRVLNFVKSKGL